MLVHPYEPPEWWSKGTPYGPFIPHSTVSIVAFFSWIRAGRLTKHKTTKTVKNGKAANLERAKGVSFFSPSPTSSFGVGIIRLGVSQYPEHAVTYIETKCVLVAVAVVLSAISLPWSGLKPFQISISSHQRHVALNRSFTSLPPQTNQSDAITLRWIVLFPFLLPFLLVPLRHTQQWQGPAFSLFPFESHYITLYHIRFPFPFPPASPPPQPPGYIYLSSLFFSSLRG